MVKTNWAIDLNAQQISRLNEHIIMADRIRKVGHSAHQGNDLLRNKLLNPNSGGGITTLTPSISLGGTVRVEQFVSMLVQNDRDSRSVASPLTPTNSTLKDPLHESGAPIDSTTFGRFVMRLQHKRVGKSIQLLCNGGLSRSDR
jgi:hypothetical protein